MRLESTSTTTTDHGKTKTEEGGSLCDGMEWYIWYGEEAQGEEEVTLSDKCTDARWQRPNAPTTLDSTIARRLTEEDEGQCYTTLSRRCPSEHLT